jgi:hypothetical protein
LIDIEKNAGEPNWYIYGGVACYVWRRARAWRETLPSSSAFFGFQTQLAGRQMFFFGGGGMRAVSGYGRLVPPPCPRPRLHFPDFIFFSTQHLMSRLSMPSAPCSLPG